MRVQLRNRRGLVALLLMGLAGWSTGCGSNDGSDGSNGSFLAQGAHGEDPGAHESDAPHDGAAGSGEAVTTGEHDSAEHDPVPSEQAEHDPVDQPAVEHDAGAPEQHEASPTPDGTCVRDAVAHCLHEHAAACDAAEHPDVCRSELEAQCKHSASETCSADDATPHSDGEHTDSGVAHPEGDQPAGDHDAPADQPAAGHGDEEPPPSEQHDAGTATGETCVHDTTAHCIEEGAHACETADHPDVCRSELERACETAAHEHCG